MLPELKIGNLVARYPIIQGGMGVGISLSSLAGAVAKSGGIGVISAAQPGWRDPEFARDPLSANLRALAFHIRRAKEISNGGIIGVNIMCALTHYEEYVRCCIENGADLIISGAGLPTDLPKYTAGSSIKLAPIVSPPRTAKVLLKLWDNHYHRVPDLVVIEGPAAGGHLGYSAETVEETARRGYDDEIREILQIVHGYEEKYACTIPVVFAGGVYTHEDILHYLSLGCAGVQMATRFVVTEECDADPRYKQAYLNAKKEDHTQSGRHAGPRNPQSVSDGTRTGTGKNFTLLPVPQKMRQSLHSLLYYHSPGPRCRWRYRQRSPFLRRKCMASRSHDHRAGADGGAGRGIPAGQQKIKNLVVTFLPNNVTIFFMVSA